MVIMNGKKIRFIRWHFIILKKHFLFFAGIYHINRGCCIVTKQSHFQYISYTSQTTMMLLKKVILKIG